MKPKFDHRVKRPFVYHTARESLEPGYLAARFDALARTQRQAAKADAERAAERESKVRVIKRKGVS